MKEKIKLSLQQGDVYSFVSDYITDNRKRSPSYKEIGKYLGVSDHRVQEIVHEIIRKGWFYFAKGVSKRKIRIKKV